MKKVLALLLVLTLLCSLTACSADIKENLTYQTYTATFRMYISSPTRNSLTNISSTDLGVAQRLTETYKIIMRSDTVLAAVIQEANLEISTDDLPEMLNIEHLENTEVLQISITADTPDEARQIAIAFTEVVPAKVQEIICSSSAKIIDLPKVVTKTYLRILFWEIPLPT